MTEPPAINCAEACTNGCIQPDNCPNRAYQTQASDFIEKTSLDEMLAMAEAAVQRRKLERLSQQEPPQWVIPDDI
ncbi:MAG: hypothetical protein ACO31I_00765 [Prochlorotrichaceae cyanobacterium]|jgi:hypothetical protein